MNNPRFENRSIVLEKKGETVTIMYSNEIVRELHIYLGVRGGIPISTRSVPMPQKNGSPHEEILSASMAEAEVLINGFLSLQKVGKEKIIRNVGKNKKTEKNDVLQIHWEFDIYKR